jgi:Mg2+/Co2+ transporter CorB
MITQLPILLVVAACLVMSFFLSGMEAGVFALSRLRIRQQMRAGRPAAQVLYRFLENPENFLWTIVVGNTLANFAIFGWLFAVLHAQPVFRGGWFLVVFVAAFFLFYAFFDLLPKMLFRTYPNRLCLALARPFRFIHLVLRPLVAVVEACSRMILRWTGGKAFTGHLFGNREELRQAMQESAQVFSCGDCDGRNVRR